jgi:2-polyprenyl-3-methyl-5-hydroxy-6-metoxy-1,4-benzoquinol methylase
MFTSLRRGVKRILLIILNRHSTTQLEDLIEKTITHRANALPPDQALRFLFRLDNRLYQFEGTKAVEYGDGVHTKHRHTRYHEFFVARVYPGDRVLDIGCGNGVMAYDLADKAGAKVVGIDIAQEKIKQAQSRYQHQNLQFMVGDILKDLPAEPFDVVILSNVLEHLEARPAFLRQVQKRVHPSRVLLRLPLYDREWRVPLKQELGVEWRLDPTHEIEYTLESFAQEMKEARLNIIHQEVRWGEIWAEAVTNV